MRHHARGVERLVVVDPHRVVWIEARAGAPRDADAPRQRRGARRTRLAARARLEDAAERDVQMFAITASKSGVDAHDDAVVRVETEAKPVVVLEVLQVEIRPLERDLAGVVEERAVEARPDLLPVFRLQQQACGPRKRYSRNPRSVSLPPRYGIR